MSNYFKNFPLIDSPTGLAKNIIARPKINMLPSSFIDYKLTDSLRPDQIAGRFYDDQSLDWVIYLANDVIDPYSDVYVDDDTLAKLVARKYGSIENATQTIVYWKTNWEVDTDQISPAVFDSLPVDVKSYYHAVTDGRKNVTGYIRKRKDIIKSTNIIARYKLSAPIDVALGEQVVLGAFQGKATVVAVDSEYLTVQHILNVFNVTTILGVPVTLVMTIRSISNTEAPYYAPVNAFDAMYFANEERRNLKLVPQSQAETLRRELKRALS